MDQSYNETLNPESQSILVLNLASKYESYFNRQVLYEQWCHKPSKNCITKFRNHIKLICILILHWGYKSSKFQEGKKKRKKEEEKLGARQLRW